MRPAAVMFALLALAFVMSVDGAPATHYRPVLRIDRVSASIQDKRLVVHAEGAVGSGGWHHPRLIVKPSAPEANILQMDFVADPPPPDHVFVQSLLPIGAYLTMRLPKYGTVAVSVATQTNELTAQIRR